MFSLDKDQLDKLNEWQKTVIEKAKDITAIGGRFTYSFTPTGIGEVVKVKDWITNEEIDLTDYDSW